METPAWVQFSERLKNVVEREVISLSRNEQQALVVECINAVNTYYCRCAKEDKESLVKMITQILRKQRKLDLTTKSRLLEETVRAAVAAVSAAHRERKVIH